MAYGRLHLGQYHPLHIGGNWLHHSSKAVVGPEEFGLLVFRESCISESYGERTAASQSDGKESSGHHFCSCLKGGWGLKVRSLTKLSFAGITTSRDIVVHPRTAGGHPATAISIV